MISRAFALGLANSHIAVAWELGVSFFATFDGRQAEIAKILKFSTNL